MAKLRIAFSGIGAVGGYYGGMVAARYQGTIKADIFFIARGENLKAIRENGLQMQLGIRTIHTAPATRITTSPSPTKATARPVLPSSSRR